LLIIPPLPLAWDTSLFVAAEAALDVLERIGTKQEFESELARLDSGLVARVRPLAFCEGEKVMLSPVVLAAFDKYRREMACAPRRQAWLSERAAKELAGSGGLRKRYDALIDRAALLDSPMELESKTNAPGLRFGPKGPVDQHIALHETDDGRVVIAAVWSTNQGYKNEIDHHGMRKDDHPPAVPWTPINRS
jgi:hypothetical protein